MILPLSPAGANVADQSVSHGLARIPRRVQRWQQLVGRWRAAILLVALSAVIVLGRLHTLHEPLERDITAYAVIAHEMLQGRALYSEMWDHKPPAVHVTYAVAELIAGYGEASIFLLAVSAGIATLLAIYHATARGLGSEKAALWAAAVWAVVSGNLALQANQPNTEVFINACLAWAFAILLGMGNRRFGHWRRVLAVGSLFALASLFKQVAVIPAGLLMAVYIWLPPGGAANRARAVRDTLAVGIIGAGAWLGVVAFFAAAGTLPDFWAAVFDYNRFYSGEISRNLVGHAAAGETLSQFIQVLHFPNWGDARVPVPRVPSWVFPDFLSFLSPLILLLVAGLGLIRTRLMARPWMFLAAYLLATQVVVALPGRFYPHYYQLWLPPIIIGSGWGLAALAQRTRSTMLLARGTAVLVLADLVLGEISSYRRPAEEWSQIKYGDIFVQSAQVGRGLRGQAGPGDSMFEWGNETGLYFYSGLRPASGITYIYPLLSGPLADDLLGQVMRDLRREKPRFIVHHTSYPLAAPIQALLDRHYHPVASAHSNENKFKLFARR